MGLFSEVGGVGEGHVWEKGKLTLCEVYERVKEIRNWQLT